MAQHPDHYAIVIGIERYPGFAAEGTAPGARADAQAIAAWLQAPDGGGLPAANVHLFLSAEDPAQDAERAGPQRWEIDRALRYLGGESGVQVGARLYFYFAGLGAGVDPEEACLLMADAAPERPDANLSLAAYHRWARESGAFRELVFVADLLRVAAEGLRRGEPALKLSRRVPGETGELVLIGATPEGSNPAARGLLTRALFEGLRGDIAGTQTVLDAEALARFVTGRVPELAAELGSSLPIVRAETVEPGRSALESTAGTSGPVFHLAGSTAPDLTGSVVVEVPHPAAALRLYDPQRRLIPEIGSLVAAAGSEFPVSETRLAPGLYEVEVSLGTQSQKQQVLVMPGRQSRIGGGSWEGLQLTSAAPLAAPSPAARRSDPERPAADPGAEEPARLAQHQASVAETMSRELTWPSSSGDSRLFLFVRTSQPEQFPRFAEGLTLLRASGEVIADVLREGKLDAPGGCMAFNAQLPAGAYLLLRSRPDLPGSRTRCQPLYLCPGWQTQVYLQAGAYASLSSLTLHMARAGLGFTAGDATAAAAQAVLDTLYREDAGRKIVSSEHLRLLLHEESSNPWLGILAAYALSRPLAEGPSAEVSAEEVERGELLERILQYLDQVAGEHPDVRALRLRMGEPAPPFPYPPLLRAGFKRVLQHAQRHDGTVPLDSLTECAAEVLLSDSPWTAWRELYALPAEWATLPAATERGLEVRGGFILLSGSNDSDDEEESHSPGDPVGAGPFESQSLQQAAPASFPVLPLGAPDGAGPDPGERGGFEPDASPLGIPAVQAGTLREATLVLAVRTLAAPAQLPQLGETIRINPRVALTARLEAQRPEEVARQAGLTRARARQALENLLALSATPLDNPERDRVLDAPEQAVLAVVLRCAAEDMPHALPLRHVCVTLEGAVERLRSEAGRVLTRASDPGPTPDPRAEALARRFRGLAERLLRGADYTVITHRDGRLMRGNGAFRSLLLERNAEGDETTAPLRDDWAAAWAAALAGAPLGSSTLATPVPGTRFSEWSLRRSQVLEEGTDDLRAYLNVLRGAGAPPLAPGLMHDLEPLLSRLSLYAPLFALGTGESRAEYAGRLEDLAVQMEALVFAPG